MTGNTSEHTDTHVCERTKKRTASASKEKVSSDLSAACQMRLPPGPVTFCLCGRGQGWGLEFMGSIRSNQPTIPSIATRSPHARTHERTVTSTGV